MKRYNIVGMSCASCSARVEKAVSKVPGVTACAVSLLTNAMTVEGSADSQAIVAAVEDAGYGAFPIGEKERAGGLSSKENSLMDHETPLLRRRLFASVGFLLILMYISMGHMMGNWPLPSWLAGNPVAIGLLQLLLAAVIMVLNQHFFTGGFWALFRGAPNMDTLVALGSTAAFVWSTAVLFRMTGAQAEGNPDAAMHAMHELYF